MTPEFRSFDPARDADDVVRIWRETRWIDDERTHKDALAVFLADGEAEVAVLDSGAESMVHRTSGHIVYDRTVLDLCAISAVTTSHVGRKLGLASTLTARALRHGAGAGAAVAVLGMFDQGFYDRFGFATAGPVVLTQFDPASLRLEHVPYRPPVRLTIDHAAEMAECLNRTMPHHGQVTLDPPRIVEAEWGFLEQPFALGYRDDAGQLTHFLAGSLKDDQGPFVVEMLGYENGSQLMELLRLLRELGDQVVSVKMVEPPQVQIHSLLAMPNRQRSRSLRSDHETVARSITWWQLRILDVPAAVAAFEWEGDPVEFDLELADPLTERLDGNGWNGVAGTYHIAMGRTSSAVPRDPSGGPRLRASVGAFTRLWFGVLPASALALAGEIAAPTELTERLDRVLRLPPLLPARSF